MIPALLRRNLDGMSVLLRGLRLLRCLSTHFSIVRTESVLGRRRSAEVRIICDEATRKVAAIPFSACKMYSGQVRDTGYTGKVVEKAMITFEGRRSNFKTSLYYLTPLNVSLVLQETYATFHHRYFNFIGYIADTISFIIVQII